MVDPGRVSRLLSNLGWFVRTSASRNQEAVRVQRDDLLDRVKVFADYNDVDEALALAEELARTLRGAGYKIEAWEGETFFYVTGYAVEEA